MILYALTLIAFTNFVIALMVLYKVRALAKDLWQVHTTVAKVYHQVQPVKIEMKGGKPFLNGEELVTHLDKSQYKRTRINH